MSLRKLLWLDCTAAFLAGAVVLALSGWLSQLYALPHAFVITLALVNLGYGTFSFSLARRQQPPRRLIVALVVANAMWAVLCGIAALWLVGTASMFGLAHLVGEGLFVGGLAALEWRHRDESGGEASPALRGV